MIIRYHMCTAPADDRPMTQKEYEEFVEVMAQAELEQHLEYLAELVAAQTIKIEEQRVYIKVLEQLEADRRNKMSKLQKTIEELEQELMRLK